MLSIHTFGEDIGGTRLWQYQRKTLPKSQLAAAEYNMADLRHFQDGSAIVH